MKIKGNDYATVAERVEEFYRRYPAPQGRIITSIVEQSPDRAVFIACIFIDGVLVATGHAEEIKTTKGVNATSYLENCETSAVGRALGNLGIGVNGSIATFEEVSAAIERQAELEAPEPVKAKPKLDYSNMKSALVTLRGETLMTDEEAEELRAAIWVHLAKVEDLNQEYVDDLADLVAQGAITAEFLEGAE